MITDEYSIDRLDIHPLNAGSDPYEIHSVALQCVGRYPHFISWVSVDADEDGVLDDDLRIYTGDLERAVCDIQQLISDHGYIHIDTAST